MSCGKCAGEPNVKLAEGMRKSGGSTKKDLVRAAEVAENSGAAAFDVFTQEAGGAGRKELLTLHCPYGMNIVYSILFEGKRSRSHQSRVMGRRNTENASEKFSFQEHKNYFNSTLQLQGRGVQTSRKLHEIFLIY